MSYLSKPNNPCKKDCESRDTYCRLSCEDYKEYEEKYKIFMEEKAKIRKKESEAICYRKDIISKQKIRKKRNG